MNYKWVIAPNRQEKQDQMGNSGDIYWRSTSQGKGLTQRD